MKWCCALLVVLQIACAASAGAQAPPAPAEGKPWKSATPGRRFAFPADHASHPEYKLEWWYYTGNLATDDGRRFGYQLTFFRIGVNQTPANKSLWAVRDLFMAHLAVTDINGRRYLFTERLNRAGPGWAGAATDRLHVWNEDWEATVEKGKVQVLRAVGTPSKGGPSFGVDLRLEDDRPPVLHGDRGYSRKGTDPGNASHYYSLPRMPTSGTLTIDGRAVAVTGLSWMDHEFGTSFLEPEQIGWDWFSIQLEDGRSLMIYRFRRADGSLDPRSSGTLVNANGTTVPITAQNSFRLEPGRTWTSAESGAQYPVVWKVGVPGLNIDLEVSAAVDAQELRTADSAGVTYWEGAVTITGQIAGSAVKGRGYLEMTGYAGASLSNVLR
jgi:predicted secreted hydrolase